MNSATTTSKIASSKKEKKDAFRGKDILPPDNITADDIHRALFNEYDMGCVSSRDDYRTVSYGNEDFTHHLF